MAVARSRSRSEGGPPSGNDKRRSRTLVLLMGEDRSMDAEEGSEGVVGGSTMIGCNDVPIGQADSGLPCIPAMRCDWVVGRIGGLVVGPGSLGIGSVGVSRSGISSRGVSGGQSVRGRSAKKLLSSGCILSCIGLLK